VKCAAAVINEPFILLYGDDIYGATGLQKLVRREWALLARRVEHPERFGVLELKEDGTVKDMVEKPQKFISDLSWVGAAKLQPEFMRIETPLSPRGEYEVTDMVNVLIKQGKNFYPELTDLWLPANTLEEVKEAEKYLAKV
jgi:dTDP-glucose pyrophosphorylase